MKKEMEKVGEVTVDVVESLQLKGELNPRLLLFRVVRTWILTLGMWGSNDSEGYNERVDQLIVDLENSKEEK